MKLVWTRTAIRDLIGIRRHIGHDNPTAAQEVASRIVNAVNKLGKHLELGRIGRVPHRRLGSGLDGLLPKHRRKHESQIPSPSAPVIRP